MPAFNSESMWVARPYFGFEDPSGMIDAGIESCVDLLIEQKPLVTTYWSELGKLK